VTKRAVPGWRVLAWKPSTMMWTVRSWHPELDEAEDSAEALTHCGVRARLVPAPRWVVVPEPARPSPARTFRQAQSAQLSDRADARRYYKSPG
jgi:hypothetical protein